MSIPVVRDGALENLDQNTDRWGNEHGEDQRQKMPASVIQIYWLGILSHQVQVRSQGLNGKKGGSEMEVHFARSGADQRLVVS